MNSSGNKNLNFADKDYVKAYAHHSIPLSIALYDDRNLPWLYEHFIQIFSFDYNTIFHIDYTEQVKQYREILEIIQIPHYKTSTITDIVPFLINSINNDLFITVFVDEFYLENRYASNRLHYLRQIAVNGYDTNTKLFHCKGFGRYTDNSFSDSGYDHYRAEDIPFETLARAYGEGYGRYEGPADQYIILWGRKKDSSGHEFNVHSFLSRLNQYITSSGYMQSQTAIGHNVLKLLEESVYWMIYERRQTVDSRAFYTIYEHSKLLLDSLKFVSRLINPPSAIFDQLLTEYASLIVPKSQKLFYQFLHFEYKARIKGYIVDQKFTPFDDASIERRSQVKDLENLIVSIQNFKTLDMTVTTNLFHELAHRFN